MSNVSVEWMGIIVSPIIAHDANGFASMVVLTDLTGEKHASRTLGHFPTNEEAIEFAVAFGKWEVKRRQLLTLST